MNCANSEIMSILIRAGTDPNTRLRNGKTLLTAFETNREMTELLLRAGADPNLRSGQYTVQSSVERAIFNGRSEILQLYVDAGVDIFKNERSEGVYLRQAAASGHTKVVEILLKAGADPNKTGSDGKSALDYAERESEISNLLVRYGAVHSMDHSDDDSDDS